MVSPQALQLVSKIQCGQDRRVHRIWGPAAGPYRLDLVIDGDCQRPRPVFVAIVARDYQTLPHYLDIDSPHRQPKSKPSNRAKICAIRDLISLRSVSCSLSWAEISLYLCSLSAKRLANCSFSRCNC